MPTIKHFVITRFFTSQDPKYPYDIFDVEFLSKQLIIAKNALNSLENQTNKNFELVFLVNEKFFLDSKYDFIFTTLRTSTTLPLRFINVNPIGARTLALMKNKGLQDLFNAAYDKYDFVIQSCMDFDDFVYKDAIEDTQKQVAECNRILSYRYCMGYMYYDEELYHVRWSFGGIGHLAIIESLILESSFAKKIPFIGIYSFPHSKFKVGMKEFLEKNHIEFTEDMFKQNMHTNAYIYFRSQFSHNNLVTNPGKLQSTLPNRKPLTTEKITRRQLEEEFGFHLALRSIE